MIIDTNAITAKDVGTGYVVGEVARPVRGLNYLEPGTIVCLFDGVNTALEYVKHKMPQARQGRSSVEEGDGDFHKFETYDEAMDVFLNRPESIVKFDETQLSIKDITEAGNIVDFDVTGDFIDMGRYLEGIPESFGTMHNGNARNRRANILVSINQTCYMSERDINHRGARILRLVDALEAGGVRCEVTAISSTQCDHVEVVMKKHEETLVISDLAVLCHSEWLRRILFRVKECSKTWEYGYGQPRKFANAVTPSLIESQNNDEIAIYVGNDMQGDWFIDDTFSKAERLMQWEMSKPVPEVASINIGNSGIRYHGNGTRSESDIVREAEEILNEK